MSWQSHTAVPKTNPEIENQNIYFTEFKLIMVDSQKELLSTYPERLETLEQKTFPNGKNIISKLSSLNLFSLESDVWDH